MRIPLDSSSRIRICLSQKCPLSVGAKVEQTLRNRCLVSSTEFVTNSLYNFCQIPATLWPRFLSRKLKKIELDSTRILPVLVIWYCINYISRLLPSNRPPFSHYSTLSLIHQHFFFLADELKDGVGVGNLIHSWYQSQATSQMQSQLNVLQHLISLCPFHRNLLLYLVLSPALKFQCCALGTLCQNKRCKRYLVQNSRLPYMFLMLPGGLRIHK